MKDLMNLEWENGAEKGIVRVWKTAKGYAVRETSNNCTTDDKTSYYDCIPTVPELKGIDSESIKWGLVQDFLNDIACHTDRYYMYKKTYSYRANGGR